MRTREGEPSLTLFHPPSTFSSHTCKTISSLGVTVDSNMDVFLDKFRGGRGVISNPKNYIADFVSFKAVYFGRKFWGKAQCNFQKGTGGLFPKKHPYLSRRSPLISIKSALSIVSPRDFQSQSYPHCITFSATFIYDGVFY